MDTKPSGSNTTIMLFGLLLVMFEIDIMEAVLEIFLSHFILIFSVLKDRVLMRLMG